MTSGNKTDKRDPAVKLYNEALSAGFIACDTDVMNLPFVTIGDFSYAEDTYGNLHMYPFKSDKTLIHAHVRTHWMEGVNLGNEYNQNKLDMTDFPYHQLKAVIGRILNMSDIMDKHGISIKDPIVSH
jgi:hypothetical protein